MSGEDGILKWNRCMNEIEELKKLQNNEDTRSTRIAIEIEYQKLIAKGVSADGAFIDVLYRKSEILWDYRRDILKEEI